MVRSRRAIGSFSAAAFIAISFVGCLAPGAETSFQVAAPVTAEDTSGGDIFLKVSLAWEGSTEFEDFSTCRIPTGSASALLSCDVKIPEARLYFSKVKFTVGTTNPGTCRILIFRPYYYQASAAAGYVSHWKSPAPGPAACNDISIRGVRPADPNCYNGAAVEIMGSDFPQYTGRYHVVTSDDPQIEFEVDASNALTYSTNRLIASGKPDPAAAIVGQYVANSLVPYSAICMDQFYEEQKQISLTITDQDLEIGEDPSDPDLDDFDDWGEF